MARFGGAFRFSGWRDASAGRAHGRPDGADLRTVAGCQFFDEDVGQAIDAFFGHDYPAARPADVRDLAAYWPYVAVKRLDWRSDCTGKQEGEAAAIEMGEGSREQTAS